MIKYIIYFINYKINLEQYTHKIAQILGITIYFKTFVNNTEK